MAVREKFEFGVSGGRRARTFRRSVGGVPGRVDRCRSGI